MGCRLCTGKEDENSTFSWFCSTFRGKRSTFHRKCSPFPDRHSTLHGKCANTRVQFYFLPLLFHISGGNILLFTNYVLLSRTNFLLSMASIRIPGSSATFFIPELHFNRNFQLHTRSHLISARLHPRLAKKPQQFSLQKIVGAFHFKL